MRLRTQFAIAAIGALALAVPGTLAQTDGHAELASRIAWAEDDPAFGGWSGLELSPDGSTFVTISDRGSIVTGRLLRDEAGQITGVVAGPIRALAHSDGGALPRYYTDSEGLALAADGRLFVSFEAEHRVDAYANVRAEKAQPLPRYKPFSRMGNNSSLEALAIGHDGALYTMPERSGDLFRPFPVYRFLDGAWTEFGEIPRSDSFLAVGADIGPDGRFYLLERRLTSVFGFSTRVRRFDMTPDGFSNETILLVTAAGVHDNLEGLAVWRDAEDQIRLTMIADDNFRFYQTTEFVEYVTTD